VAETELSRLFEEGARASFLRTATVEFSSIDGKRFLAQPPRSSQLAYVPGQYVPKRSLVCQFHHGRSRAIRRGTDPPSIPGICGRKHFSLVQTAA
jgi:hypothetical protein